MEEKKTSTNGNFDTLVLSGGSVNGINIIGALQYIYDTNLHTNISIYVGTSVGAVISYLLAIGYNPMEIITQICVRQLLEKMKYLNFVEVSNGNGATTFNHINQELEKLTIEKLGRLITLGELFTKYKKRIVCVTYNWTLQKTEYIDHTNYPDMPCLIALRLSANLPFIFDRFKYLGSYYVDGGVSDDFPINKGVELGKKVLGISRIYKVEEEEKEFNLVTFFYQLISVPVNIIAQNQIDKSSENAAIFLLNSDKKFYEFNLDNTSKLNMFSDGYQEMKKLWEIKN